MKSEIYVHWVSCQCIKLDFFLDVYDVSLKPNFSLNTFFKIKSALFRNERFMLDKCPSEMLQNLPYFWSTKAHVVFVLFFISCYFIFSHNECPGLCLCRFQKYGKFWSISLEQAWNSYFWRVICRRENSPQINFYHHNFNVLR